MRIAQNVSLVAVALLFLLLIMQVLNVPGQSGNRPAPDLPSHAPATVAVDGLDLNRDEYRLVYSSRIQSKDQIREKEKVLQPGSHTWVNMKADFIDELNSIGAQGYRLLSFASAPAMAVMKRNDYRYEYTILNIANRKDHFDGNAGFATTYAPWARAGFRVFDYLVSYDQCWSVWNPTIERDDGIDCYYDSQVVLERQKDAEVPLRYEVVNAQLTLKAMKLDADLAEQLAALGKSNLYPTHVLTKFQVFMQDNDRSKWLASDDYETATVSGDVRKEINKLAQQGYRLLLRPVLDEIAIMQRKKAATSRSSYIWVNDNRLESEVGRLQAQGAIYRMSYGCGLWINGGIMIFEQPSVSDNKRREYRILSIELKAANDGQHRAAMHLTPSLMEISQQLNRLAKEGFEVKDFFSCDERDYKKRGLSRAKLLLERVS